MNVQQRLLRRVIGQFTRPHGLGGRISGWVMAHRSSNVERNRWVVSLLDVQPADRVLEIGFGPGVAIAELSRLVPLGKVFGVDHSEVMVRAARKRNAAAVRAGRVDLRLATAEKLPDLGAPVDKVLAVNCLGFWRDPVACLHALRPRLSSEGVLALASQPRCRGATSETSERAAQEIEALLSSVGFTRTRTETLALDPPVVCVLARQGGESPEPGWSDGPPVPT
jgi:SAM-dependent methyltransferase